MRRGWVVFGLILWLATAAVAQLNWVGNTRLYATGFHALPSRLGMIDPWQVITITTQTNPIAPGQSVQAVVTTDNWRTTREYDFSFDFNTGGNTQWYLVLPPYPAGTHVQFYIRARGANGEVRFDNNGGSNYSVWVRYAPRYRETPILQWFQTDYRTIMQRLPEVVDGGLWGDLPTLACQVGWWGLQHGLQPV
jgi:hypothetical protein